jgi:hypothetical protein
MHRHTDFSAATVHVGASDTIGFWCWYGWKTRARMNHDDANRMLCLLYCWLLCDTRETIEFSFIFIVTVRIHEEREWILHNNICFQIRFCLIFDYWYHFTCVNDTMPTSNLCTVWHWIACHDMTQSGIWTKRISTCKSHVTFQIPFCLYKQMDTHSIVVIDGLCEFVKRLLIFFAGHFLYVCFCYLLNYCNQNAPTYIIHIAVCKNLDKESSIFCLLWLHN